MGNVFPLKIQNLGEDLYPTPMDRHTWQPLMIKGCNRLKGIILGWDINHVKVRRFVYLVFVGQVTLSTIGG